MTTLLRAQSPAPLAPRLLAPPLRGAADPSAPGQQATTPGSFAHAPDLGGPLAFSSPDTPGMPAPSAQTAWDFLPDGWTVELLPGTPAADLSAPRPLDPAASRHLDTSHATFTTVRGQALRVTFPRGFRPLTQLEHARLGLITPEMRRVAQREPHFDHLSGGRGPEAVRDEVAAGRMVIPANPVHLGYRLDAMAIGRASLTKINANMGASPVSSSTAEEVEKLRWAQRWGADTVMDLSTGGDLAATREAIIRDATVPIGTVPIYSMIIGRRLEDLTPEVILAEIERQARQGVDYMTIHAGVRRAHLKHVKRRLIGIVSRGGSLLAKWMLVHNRENPMYDHWDDICRLLRAHDVTFSIGDGLRPGGLADASDLAQLAELETLGELTERAWRHGVQVMVEGPGHVPFDQIEWNMKVQRRLCHGAPFYVLGPLVTDMFPGYDHITSCIGATAAAYHGASMLCYVTPKEHLGLPKKDDVKQGCVAYKIAAHAADVALGIPGARTRDDELTKARAALNWEKHFELSFDPDTARALHDEDLDADTDFCAMCGHDWCSVRISKEIQEFASGKAEGFERLGGRDGQTPGAPRRSDALTPEQQEILAKRGVLSPEEIHKLASKATKAALPGATVRHPDTSAPRHPDTSAPSSSPKLSCHSDYVPDAEEARRRQRAAGVVVVQVDVRPALGIGKDDRVI
ncbi:MAG TPA: phosphomethylpyrimidine synthase [Phycisphaerales bacterium]|nr:phosphomethylpyrimidine synthase [Phycisphaerales bacterium]